MIPRLTDFSSKELTWLGVLLTNEKEKLFKALEQIDSFDSDEMKAHFFEHFRERLEICTQWDTKVMEASVELKMQENIKSN